MGLSLNNYNLFVIKKLKISWILSCIQFPLYLTSKIIPKKEIFLYGSMNGYCIADNSKYHYLNNLNKKKFFILNNKKNYNYFKKIGYNVILSKSFKGIWLQLISKHIYWTHGLRDFIPYLVAGGNVTGLQHGAPIKKGGKARERHILKKKEGFIKKLKLTIRNFIYFIAPYTNNQHCDITICGEKKFKEYVKEVFEYSNPKIKEDMLPRIKYAPKRVKENFILYAPTHRGYQSIDQTLKDINFDFQKIKNLLKEIDFKLYIRPHPLDLNNQIIEQISKNNNDIIKIDKDEDLYSKLNSFKLVMTDFSSIYQDSIWLNIPVNTVSTDLELYNKEYGLFDWYIREIEYSNFIDFEKCIKSFLFNEKKNH